MVCLETSFLVDFLRGRQQAVDKMAELELGREPITVTAPSVFEMVERAALASTAAERERIAAVLSALTQLPLNGESAWEAGELSASLIKGGDQMGQMDTVDRRNRTAES